MNKTTDAYREWVQQEKERAYEESKQQQDRYEHAESDWQADRERHKRELAKYTPEELERAGRAAIAEAKRLAKEVGG